MIDFMLKDDKVIHEERPEGKIVGGNVYEFDNLTKEVEKGEVNAIEAPPAEETPAVEDPSIETVAPEEVTNE